MDVTAIASLVGNVGFPIAVAIGLAYFAWYMINKSNENYQKYYDELQKRCLHREEVLFEQLKESQEINKHAIETIASYTDKLDVIQKDVSEIKNDVVKIMAKG